MNDNTMELRDIIEQYYPTCNIDWDKDDAEQLAFDFINKLNVSVSNSNYGTNNNISDGRLLTSNDFAMTTDVSSNSIVYPAHTYNNYTTISDSKVNWNDLMDMPVPFPPQEIKLTGCDKCIYKQEGFCKGNELLCNQFSLPDKEEPEIEYSIDNDSNIIEISKVGILSGNYPGDSEISISCNDITTTIGVSVYE
jgi:hypothetical protein